MGIMDLAAWCVIIGLSFISIGGLLLWTYGETLNTRRTEANDMAALVSKRRFSGVLIYSVALIMLGLGSLVQGTLFILHGGA
jgi:hypothetical protein